MESFERCKAEVQEYAKRNTELYYELKKKNDEIAEKDDIIKDLSNEIIVLKQEKLSLPAEPIEVAAMLIKSTITIKANPIQKAFNKDCLDELEVDRYSGEDLMKIAQHLMVYCGKEEE